MINGQPGTENKNPRMKDALVLQENYTESRSCSKGREERVVKSWHFDQENAIEFCRTNKFDRKSKKFVCFYSGTAVIMCLSGRGQMSFSQETVWAGAHRK